MSSTSNEPWSRVEDRTSAWRVVVERIRETESSVLVFGRRDNQPVVLKVIRDRGDERRCGEILKAFEGNGVVRVYDYAEGAILLERVAPGNLLVELVLDGSDDRATEILAGVVAKMSPRTPPDGVPEVQDWARGFERHIATGASPIPEPLLVHAHRMYSDLCDSQARPRLRHGDLHHHNVLFDSARGWLAIDPKGVIGELEYEIGAALRNPHDQPDLFAKPATIERRVERLARTLDLDAERTLAWGFAQAVLAAIWAIEDGFRVRRDHPWLELARVMQSILASP